MFYKRLKEYENHQYNSLAYFYKKMKRVLTLQKYMWNKIKMLAVYYCIANRFEHQISMTVKYFSRYLQQLGPQIVCQEWSCCKLIKYSAVNGLWKLSALSVFGRSQK